MLKNLFKPKPEPKRRQKRKKVPTSYAVIDYQMFYQIIDAGYTEYNDEYCIYAVYLSPLLGYRRTYFLSLDLGLVIASEEVDSTGTLIYRMIAHDTVTGEADPTDFTLPDGTLLEG